MTDIGCIIHASAARRGGTTPRKHRRRQAGVTNLAGLGAPGWCRGVPLVAGGPLHHNPRDRQRAQHSPGQQPGLPWPRLAALVSPPPRGGVAARRGSRGAAHAYPRRSPVQQFMGLRPAAPDPWRRRWQGVARPCRDGAQGRPGRRVLQGLGPPPVCVCPAAAAAPLLPPARESVSRAVPNKLC